MTTPTVRDVIPPNPTNSRSSWIDQVVAYYVTSILFGNDNNVPPVGPRLPEYIVQQYFGIGKTGQDYNAGPLINLVKQWASWVADNWGTAGSQLASMGWSLGAPPAQDLPDIQTQVTIRGQDVDIARAQIEADATKYAADKQLEAALAHAQATKYAADRQKEATITAADIAAKAEIEAAAIRARADENVARIQQETAIEVARIQTENEWRIFLEAEAGRNRRFDLQLAEDQRQFNALLALDLYKLGIELSRNPVDWIAYQYYLSGMGAPTTFANLTAFATVLGSIPPVGPSNYGPVTGGPATYTGQWEMAASTGAMPAFATATGASQFTGLAGDAPFGFTARFDLQQVESQLAAAREGIAGATGMQVYMAAANAGIEAAQGSPVTLTLPDGQQITGTANASVFNLIANSELGQDQDLVQALDQSMQAEYGITLQDAADLTQALYDYSSDQKNHEVPLEQFIMRYPAAPPAQGGVAQAYDDALKAAGLKYQEVMSQAQQQQQQNNPLQSPLPNPQTGLLEQLAAQTGLPTQQLASSAFLPGNWGWEGVMQNPFTQALMAGTTTPLYRKTDPTGWQRFGAVPAMGGAQTGIRSGQDINANAFNRMLPSQQEMTRGLMEATGQYWPDVVEQMLRASPAGISPFAPGSVGRRS